MSSAILATLVKHEIDPEIDLMLRVQEEESGAFQELIDLYWSRVFGRFFRQFGDRQEAEDLAQDVFLRVYRNRKRYRPTARFSTWFYHIAKNVARNAIRTRLRRPLQSVGMLMDDEGHTLIRSVIQTPEVPSLPLEREELAHVVRDAVTQLLDRQRTAVELQFQDRSYSEIAAELDMTPKAAKSLLYRARNQLRESLLSYVDCLG